VPAPHAHEAPPLPNHASRTRRDCPEEEALAEEKVEKASGEEAAVPARAWLEAGDAVYVCAHGPDCHCDGISAGPGECPCGTEMVQAS
jgi:hypothetical protein